MTKRTVKIQAKGKCPIELPSDAQAAQTTMRSMMIDIAGLTRSAASFAEAAQCFRLASQMFDKEQDRAKSALIRAAAVAYCRPFKNSKAEGGSRRPLNKLEFAEIEQWDPDLHIWLETFRDKSVAHFDADVERAGVYFIGIEDPSIPIPLIGAAIARVHSVYGVDDSSWLTRCGQHVFASFLHVQSTIDLKLRDLLIVASQYPNVVNELAEAGSENPVQEVRTGLILDQQLGLDVGSPALPGVALGLRYWVFDVIRKVDFPIRFVSRSGDISEVTFEMLPPSTDAIS